MLSEASEFFSDDGEPSSMLPRPNDMKHTGRYEVEIGLEDLLPRLWRFAISLTRNDTAAEDLVQDTCIRMLEKAEQFRPGTHLDRWGFTVMVNIFRSGLRRKPHQPMDDEAMAMVEDEKPLPDKLVFVNEVLAEIERLPEGQRSLIVLVYGEGFSYREASEVLGIPLGTVMSRLYAARGKLAHLAS